MVLKTTLLGKTYAFRDIKDVLAKANEEKSGDKLAGLSAENHKWSRRNYGTENHIIGKNIRFPGH